MNNLLAALQFMSIIPIRKNFEEDNIGKSLIFFPIVGLIIGGISAGVLYLFHLVCEDPIILSFFAVSLLGIFSGGLHLDGVSDSADGLMSARTPERMLEIMRDSRIGAMGVLALLFVLGLKFVSFRAMPFDTLLRSLIVIPVLSRSFISFSFSLFPYARSQGMASLFIKYNGVLTLLCAATISVLALVLAFGIHSYLVLITAAIVFVAFQLFLIKKIGGITGDTTGATVELVEAFCFLTIAVASL